MTRRLLIIFGLFCLFSVVQAQNEQSLPIFNTDDIFLEGVIILEQLPTLIYDNDNLQLHYFNPESQAWEAYDYPEELTYLAWFNQNPNPDGTYLLAQYAPISPTFFTQETTWLFDPETGEIRQQYESQLSCGVFPTYHLLYENSERWIVDEENQQLCNIETGQTAPLPTNEYQTALYQHDFGIIMLATTSNEDYVVLGNYVYDIATEEWRYIGVINNYGEMRKVSLFKHLIVFIQSGPNMIGNNGNYASNPILLIADARVENSLIYISQLPDSSYVYYNKSPYTFDGEERFVWGEIWDDHLVFLEYNLGTQEFSVLYTGGQPVSNPYQAGSEMPDAIYLYPENESILGFQAGGTFRLLNLETEEVIANGIRFQDWISGSRVLIHQPDNFIYDYVISPSNNSVSGLDWVRPNIFMQPSLISPDKQYMLVRNTMMMDSEMLHLQIVALDMRQALEQEITLSIPSQYNLRWYWQDDNSVIAKLNEENQPVSRWHIQIDAIAEANS